MGASSASLCSSHGRGDDDRNAEADEADQGIRMIVGDEVPAPPVKLLWEQENEEAEQRVREQERLEEDRLLREAKKAAADWWVPHFEEEWRRLLDEIGGSLDEAESLHDQQGMSCGFDMLDTNGDGKLDTSELGAVFEKIGVTTRPRRIEELVRIASAQNSGFVPWMDFDRILRLGYQWHRALQAAGKRRKGEPVPESSLLREFEAVNAGESAGLRAEELARVFEALQIEVQGDLVSKLVVLGEEDCPGTIGQAEFLKLFEVVNAAILRAGEARETPGRAKRLRRKSTSSDVSSKGTAAARTRAGSNSSAGWQVIMQQVSKKSNILDKATLRKEFDKIDTSGDGSVDAAELGVFFKGYGFNMVDSAVKEFINQADDDRSGTLEWSEFYAMFEVSVKWAEMVNELARNIQVKGPLTEAALRRQFCSIDVDHSGSLDVDELSRIFSNLNIKITREGLEKLLKIIDTDGSGFIEWPEFKAMFDVVRNVSSKENSAVAFMGG